MTPYQSITRTLVLLICTLCITACGTLRPNLDDPGPVSATPADIKAEKGSAEALYATGKRALNRRNFETAISRFEELEATFPFGAYAAQAQLDIAYAHYRQTEYESATATIDRYLQLYPNNEHADYAYYLTGLAKFAKGKSFFDSIVSRKLHQTDQATMREAATSFSTLARKFPDSEYAEDAKARVAVLRDAMARHELSAALYYYDRSAMVAVINRVNYMIEQYRDSAYTNDGLALMTRAHGALGNTDLARATLLMLEQSDPEHRDLRKLEKFRS